MTALAVARRPATRRSPTVHTVRRLAAALVTMALWFWGIALVAIVLGNVVGWAVAGATDVSIAIYARQAALWFPFSLGIMMVVAYLRPHLAAGMTRRTFVRATVLVQVAAGTGYALVLTTLVLVERTVHDALGWQSAITEIQLTDASSPAWMLLLDLVVPFVLGNLSGLLVGSVYQLFGGWWGTLTLPLTVGPVAVSQFVSGARLADLPGRWTGWTTTPAGDIGLVVGIGAVLAAVMVTVHAVLVRRAQLPARA